MPIQTIKVLRERAEMARRISVHIYNVSDQHDLLQIADDLESEADKLESESGSPPKGQIRGAEPDA